MKLTRQLLSLKNILTYFFPFCFISIIFWIIRLWRFEELMTFYSDQSLFMNDIKDMVDLGKIRLIGAMVVTKTFEGRGFFTGPLFYYLITPLALMAKWDVILMTKLFMGLWWLAGIGVFLWICRVRGYFAGIVTYAIYSVFPYFVDYSRFLWNPSILPLLSVGFFWILRQLWVKTSLMLWFILGVISGAGFDLQYDTFGWLLIVTVFYLIGLKRKKWFPISILIFVLGIIVIKLPFLIFELRHNFYNLRTFIFVLTSNNLEELNGKIGLYHLIFPYFSIFFLAVGWGFEKIYKKTKTVAIVAGLLIIIVCLFSYNWQKSEGTGMPSNWNVIKQKQTIKLITEDIENSNFEVASIVGGDTRATDLRWWLRMKNHLPLGVEDYEKTDVLYLVAPLSRPPEKETVWEIKVLRPFEVEKTWDLGSDMFLYKLIRLPKESK